MLTDAQWQVIEHYFLGKRGDPGQTGGDGRLFVEAVLWIARTGSPWRDLPDAFGHWNSVFKRFRRWVQRGETTGVAALLEGLDFGALLGDKAYDADWLRRDLQQRRVEAVIPPRAKRLNPANYDAEKYKWRHLVENFFQRLKEFRGIAMRSCKTDSSFAAIIYLAATVLRTR
jgi:transposase